MNGKIAVTFDSDTDDLTYSFRLRSLETSVIAGTHIHSGTSCTDMAAVGGHYWDAGSNGTNPDPWTSAYGAVYETNGIGSARGSFELNSGYGFEENLGHAVVVHASDGTRVGCGVLQTGKTRGCGQSMAEKKLQACISAYPGTEYPASGKVAVVFNTTTDDLTYNYKFRNLESSVVAGTHIHSGTACDDLVGGHYWDAGSNGTNPDPWTSAYGAVYETDANGNGAGSFSLNSGYDFEENVGHAVVLHASDGTRVGCGVLGRAKVSCFNN